MATVYQILYTYRKHPHWVEEGTLLVTDRELPETPEWATIMLHPDETIRGSMMTSKSTPTTTSDNKPSEASPEALALYAEMEARFANFHGELFEAAHLYREHRDAHFDDFLFHMAEVHRHACLAWGVWQDHHPSDRRPYNPSFRELLTP